MEYIINFKAAFARGIFYLKYKLNTKLKEIMCEAI